MSPASPSVAASGLSALFSLSNAAASASPMPVSTAETGKAPKDSKDLASGKNGSHVLKHRRLNSTGQTRRRMSDARDAVARPNPVNVSAASALASLSSLSLSSSGIAVSVSSAHTNLHSHPHHTRANVSKHNVGNGQQDGFLSVSYDANPVFNGSVPIAIASHSPAGAGATSSYQQDMVPSVGDDIEVDVEDFDDNLSVAESVVGRGPDKKGRKGGSVKKRGTIFQCESCSKVYRHPSCLVKHRWEHSPHWREASKFLLSKHQQVQLLEAAAILSHLDPGSSLPEDRSLWPSYLSGGLLPPPTTATAASTNPFITTISARPSAKTSAVDAKSSFMTHLVSSSVPVGIQAPRFARNRSGSVSTLSASGTGSGPRMHDYTVQGGITQIRPGLLAHPTAPTATPPEVLAGTTVSPYAGEEMDTMETTLSHAAMAMAVTHPSKPQPMAVPVMQGDGNSNDNAYSGYRDAAGSVLSTSGVSVESGSLAYSGGWSLPRSDLRSSSVARSYSASHAGSRSDDEDDNEGPPEGTDEEGDVDVDVADGDSARFGRGRFEPEFEGYDGPKYGFAQRRSDRERAAVKNEMDDEWGMEMDMEL